MLVHSANKSQSGLILVNAVGRDEPGDSSARRGEHVLVGQPERDQHVEEDG